MELGDHLARSGAEDDAPATQHPADACYASAAALIAAVQQHPAREQWGVEVPEELAAWWLAEQEELRD
jgi:hypothetical protein